MPSSVGLGARGWHICILQKAVCITEQLSGATLMMALTQPHSQRQMDLFSVSFWALAVRGSAQNPCHSEGELLLGRTA